MNAHGSLRGVWVLFLLALLTQCVACGWDGPAEALPTASLLSITVAEGTPQPTDDRTDVYTMRRQNMVQVQIQERGITDKDVLRAMEKVPRHEFVPANYVNQAYEDYPLPIGHGQTISQPYIVAVMTEILRLRSDARVLEIGTGSGYQAAILAELTSQVYTVEIVEPLYEEARNRLERLGFTNVQVQCADGYDGWEEHAPYDAIIVTAAPDHIPQPLIDQLADGGRMIVPVGPPGAYQVLWVVERDGEKVKTELVMGVAFVPLTRR